MKKSLYKKGILLLCSLFLFGSLSQVHAQFPGGGPGLPGGDDDVNDEAPPAPINGFIGIALAAGAYFGARKLREKEV